MGYRVVVVGATGNVGREMLNILAEREFPCDEIAAAASSRSTGDEIEYGDTGRMIKVKNLGNATATFDLAATLPAGSPHTISVSPSTVTVRGRSSVDVRVTLKVPVATAGWCG